MKEEVEKLSEFNVKEYHQSIEYDPNGYPTKLESKVVYYGK